MFLAVCKNRSSPGVLAPCNRADSADVTAETCDKHSLIAARFCREDRVDNCQNQQFGTGGLLAEFFLCNSNKAKVIFVWQKKRGKSFNL
jgi:hypothetical protein